MFCSKRHKAEDENTADALSQWDDGKGVPWMLAD